LHEINQRDFYTTDIFFYCGSTQAQEIANPHRASLAALRAGNLQKLKDLVERHGANINSRRRPGESSLMMSIKTGSKEITN
jgi:DNA-binding FadR family transcriptional regulator